MLRWFEHKQVYHPKSDWVTTGSEIDERWEDFYFNSADGTRLNGWFFPAAKDSPRRALVVLICHGNGGNISHRAEVTAILLRLGLNVLLFDYRGFGRSAGRPSEEGTYQDAQAAHAWLVKRGFAPQNIIGMGESLGGGVVSELAVRETLGGLILQITFTSIVDVGAELFPWLPVRWISQIKYDTRSRLPRIRIPVMVMHSRADRLIKFHHGERNFATANEPKLFWELSGDHNEAVSSDPVKFAEGVERFLMMVEAARKTENNGPR